MAISCCLSLKPETGRGRGRGGGTAYVNRGVSRTPGAAQASGDRNENFGKHFESNFWVFSGHIMLFQGLNFRKGQLLCRSLWNYCHVTAIAIKQQ